MIQQRRGSNRGDHSTEDTTSDETPSIEDRGPISTEEKPQSSEVTRSQQMFIDVIIIVNKEIIIQQTFRPRREVMTFSRNIIRISMKRLIGQSTILLSRGITQKNGNK